jgi:LEA14-like dessication related protein
MDDVRITGLNFSEVQLTFDVLVKNPNRISLDLSSYSYEFDIAGETMIRGNGKNGLLIPADSSVLVPLVVDLSYSSLVDIVSNYRSSEKAAYSFRSTFNVDMPIMGNLGLPVEKTGEIPLIKRPRLKLTGLALENLSFSKADLSIGIQLSNPNDFELNLRDLDFLVNLEGISALNGQSEGLSIPAKDHSEIRVPLRISFTDLGMAAYRALTGSSVISIGFESTALIDAGIDGFRSSVLEFSERSDLKLNRSVN